MDRGAWGATVHRVAWLKHLSTHTRRVLLFLASMVHPRELTTQTLAGYTVWCTTMRAQGRQRHAFHLLRECSVAEFIGLFTSDWSSNCPSWTFLKFVLVPSGCLTTHWAVWSDRNLLSHVVLEAWSPKSRCQQGHAPSELWRGVRLCLSLASGSWSVVLRYPHLQWHNSVSATGRGILLVWPSSSSFF